MSNKENTNLGAVKIPVARVTKRSSKAKVLAGNLSSTQCVYLYPPKIKGNDWGLAIGAKGEKPRIMTNLKEIADGVCGRRNRPRRSFFAERLCARDQPRAEQTGHPQLHPGALLRHVHGGVGAVHVLDVPA